MKKLKALVALFLAITMCFTSLGNTMVYAANTTLPTDLVTSVEEYTQTEESSISDINNKTTTVSDNTSNNKNNSRKNADVDKKDTNSTESEQSDEEDGNRSSKRFVTVSENKEKIPKNISDPEKIITKLYIDGDKTDFLTGSEVRMFAGVELSGVDSYLNGAYMIVTVPKEYLDTSYNSEKGLNISNGISLLHEPELTSDNDFYYIRYDYKDLKGGTLVELPFFFKTKNYTTPPDTQIKVTAKLYNADKTLMGEKNLSITNKSSGYYTTVNDSKYFVESRAREGNPTNTSSNLDELDVVYANLVYKNNVSGTLGVYQPEKLKMVVKLKEGVVFDKTFNELNEAWTYDEASRTLTKITDPIIAGIPFESGIYLKMPNVEYGKYYEAFTGQVVAINNDGNEVESTRSNISTGRILIIKRTPPVYNYGVSIHKSKPIDYNYLTSNRDKVSSWTLTTKNYSSWGNVTQDTPKEDILPKSVFVGEVEDYGLDSHLYYYSVKIDSLGSSLTDKEQLKKNILYGENSKGEKTVISSNIDIDKEFIIPAENHLNSNDVYRKLYFTFPDRVEVKEKEQFKIIVNTKVFEQDWDNAVNYHKEWFLGGDKELVNEDLHNYSKATYYKQKEGSESFTENTFIYYTINAGGKVKLTSVVDYASRLIGEIAKTTFTIAPSGITIDENGKKIDLKNGKLAIVIPNGWEYVNEETAKTQLKYTEPNGSIITKDVEPKLEYDYEGTGKRALVFELPERKANTNAYAYINLRATSSTPTGESTIEGYLAYENNGKYQYMADGTINVNDEWDLNSNGIRDDTIPKSTQTISYTPPREVVGVKKVGKSIATLTPTGTHAIDIGEEFYYGFDIINLQKSETIKSLSIIDILPYVNDKAVVPNSEGLYKDRESQYRVSINGPVKFLKDGVEVSPEESGFEILYSTETPANGNLESNLEKNFSKNVADWSKVTMIKVNLLKGTEIVGQSEVNFVVPATIPNEKNNIKDGDIAFNSFALATSNTPDSTFTAESYIEAIKVAVPVVLYNVSGTVYRDFNIDSLFSINEKGISGINLGLYDSKGELIDETTTNEKGYYKFDVIPRGEYYVKVIEKPEDMQYPNEDNHNNNLFPEIDTSNDKQLVGGLEVGHDVDGQGTSQKFSLDPLNKQNIVNVALEDKPFEIPVEKQWIGKGAEVDSISLKLHGKEQEKNLEIKKADGWKGKFMYLRERDENGVKIDYILSEETETTGYTTSIIFQNKGFIVKNISDETRSIKINKKWIGKSAEKVDISILADGNKVGTIELNNENGWSKTVNDLPLFDKITGKEIVYTVEESLNGYNTEISGNENDGFIVTNINTEKISIPVTKKWIGSSEKKVTIRLLSDGKEIESIELTSDNDWKGKFSELFKYDQNTGKEIVYTVKEDVLKGYKVEIIGGMDTGFTIINTEIQNKPVKPEPSTPENQKPDTTKNTEKDQQEFDSPMTGDTSDIILWLLICEMAILYISGMAILRKRKK